MSGVDNPSAFPEVPGDFNGYEGRAGMTLRDWFAGQAVAGFSAPAWQSGDWDEAVMARLSYAIADAMLAERMKPSPLMADHMQHVAYYDEGQFHWMSGIAPRDCELFAKPVGGGQ